MAISNHDAFRQITAQNVAIAASGGASAQSTAFSSQTYFIRVCLVGVVDTTNNGCRIRVGDNPVASSTTSLLPLNWVETYKCTPGQKIAVVSNTATTGSLSVTELTD